jgi:hypothetical protein
LKWSYILTIGVGVAITIMLIFTDPDVRDVLDKTNYNDNGTISSNGVEYYSFTEGKYGAKYYIEVNSTNPLDVYVIPSEKQFEFFKKGESFNYFDGCQGENTKFFTITCNVGNYIGIILYNPNNLGHDEITKFSIKIREI